jgi:hypothetical protein
LYNDNAHLISALLTVKLPRVSNILLKFTGGGSFYLSSGIRPTSYCQPAAKLSAAAGKGTTWFAEWRYYGYTEPSYLYEGFRAHVVTAGVRITR